MTTNLALKTRLLLFNAADFGDEGLDLFLLFLDADGVLAADLLNLFSPGRGLSLELGLPVGDLAVGLNKLAFQVQTGLGFLLKLDADRLQVYFNLGVLINDYNIHSLLILISYMKNVKSETVRSNEI